MGMRKVLSLGREKYHRDKTVQSAYRDIYLISGAQTCCLDPAANQREKERERGGLRAFLTDLQTLLIYIARTPAIPTITGATQG